MAARQTTSALTVGDLVAAREAYHVHLLALPHVVATAIGRYLVRTADAERETSFEQRLALAPGERPPRTLENTRTASWSWPCVLVLVDHWMTAAEIGRAPDAMVPRQLFLPDGRVVPTCVIYAPPAHGPADRDQHLSFPTALLGGGYVCLADVQGQERAATVACLVTDGDRVFALTNRHVAGEAGRRLYTEVEGSRVDIGVSTGHTAARVPLASAYPGLAAPHVELTIDAGLIELTDTADASTQVFGIGRLGPLVDIGPHTLSLDLVGQRVRAFGGASGPLAGEIVALYYRYKALAGVEYVADALIGPRAGTRLATRPGDSGTLWVLDGPPLGDPGEDPRPVALQWGGHRFAGARGASPYALATFLSTALRALDVDLVPDWNADHPAYWGITGHYTIGGRACDLVKPAGLRRFFIANRTRIAFELADIASGEFAHGDGLFTPLADVPDRVWKHPPRGTTVRRRGREGPNHFADIDQPAADGKTLLDHYREDRGALTPSAWLDFYAGLVPAPDALGQGLLPFRVAQLFREMVERLRAGDVLRGLAAGGVMAHYVGDACQPLHASQFSNGRPGDSHHDVHGNYEDKMLDRHRPELVAGLDTALAALPAPRGVADHRAAARALTDLMVRTADRLSPAEIMDAWNAPGATVATLWEAVGPQTVDCIADGCLTLAMLWSSAFRVAGAPAPPPEPLSKDDLVALYGNESFATSMTLPLYAASGLW